MGWISLQPPAVVKGGRPMISVLVRKKKSGAVSCRFSFSSFLQDELGDPKTAAIDVDDANQATQLRFVFGPGPFAVKGFGKGGFAVLLEGLPGAPDRDFGSTGCRLVSKEGCGGGLGEVVVGLPLDDWFPRAKPAAPPAPAAPKPPAPGRPLDAADYLTRKGHRVSSMAEGRISVDGDTLTHGAVVKMVNKYRAKEGLDPLNPDCVV